MNTLNKINNIPVRTWRWLGVNNISINDTVPEMKPYTLNILSDYNHVFHLIPMNQEKNSLPILNAFDNTGISEELTKSITENYNTGFFLETKKDQKGKEIIKINYEFDKENNVVIDNNLIVAEEGSEITVFVNYNTIDDTKAFHNGLTRIYCKKNATVNLVKIQTLSDTSTHLDACMTKLEENANVNYILIELGGEHSITNVKSDMEGDKSTVGMHTVYLGDKERKLDINYLVNHYGRETKSNIEVKGALLDKSNKIFKGTIDFKKGAAKSIGKEEEYAVLLSKDVRNRSVPVLLCTEDDVSGQHAASAGKVDENKLFYLMTRGFSEMEAKKLIIEAAIRPIIDLIPEKNTKNTIYEEIRRKLIVE